MSKRNHWAVPGFSALVLLTLAACSGGGGSSGSSGGVGNTPSSGTSDPTVVGGGSDGAGADGGTGGTGGDSGDSGDSGSGDSAGSGGDMPPPPPPPPAAGTGTNPYATAGSDTPNRLGRLHVFGDSYSDTDSRFRSCGGAAQNVVHCTPKGQMWSERLVASGSGATLRSYARDGASALDGGVYAPNDNDFKSQVDQWAAGPDLGANDLSIVYMGYNDVNARSGQDASIADYAAQVDRLIAGGATASERRLFLTLIHDFGAVPSSLANPGGDKGGRTRAINAGIAGIVGGKANVVAVDMFTVFNRIAANPGRYGLTDVTSVPDAGDDAGRYLYADPEHFSARGQELVAQVYNHYLTRGWALANTLEGSRANRDELNNDVDNRLAQLSLIEGGATGFTSYFVGDDEAAAMGGYDVEMGDPSRSGFDQLTRAGRADAGIGLDYSLDAETRLGVVMSRYGNDQAAELGANATRLATESDAVSVYLESRFGAIDLGTRASFADDTHEKTTFNEVVGEANSARHGGRTMSISQTASTSLRLGRAWLQPWVDVTHTEQEIDGYTIANPFVSDLTYSGGTVTDTMASLGLNATSDRFTLGNDTGLTLTGSLGYTRSLRTDDYEVTIEEAALAGLEQSETVEREGANMIGLRLGSVVDMGESVSLSADYALTKQMGVEADHALTARFNYRF